MEKESTHISAGTGFLAIFESDIRDTRGHDDELVRAITRELLHEGVSLREKRQTGMTHPSREKVFLLIWKISWSHPVHWRAA